MGQDYATRSGGEQIQSGELRIVILDGAPRGAREGSGQSRSLETSYEMDVTNRVRR